jgi:hypothetical protein
MKAAVLQTLLMSQMANSVDYSTLATRTSGVPPKQPRSKKLKAKAKQQKQSRKGNRK